MTVERIVAGVIVGVALAVTLAALAGDWTGWWLWSVVVALLGVRLWLGWRGRR